MRESNQIAATKLLKLGFDQIWMKSHTRFNDWVYCRGYKYEAKDVWRLFDGACWKDKKLYFFQIASGYFHKREPIEKFLTGTGITCLNINVTESGEVKIVYLTGSNLINDKEPI